MFSLYEVWDFVQCGYKRKNGGKKKKTGHYSKKAA